MDWQPTPLEEQRLSKLQELSDLGINPYPLRVNRTHKVSQAIETFLEFEGKEKLEEKAVSVCGRIVSVRDMGKTVFAHIEDGTGQLQLFIRRDEIGEEAHTTFRKLLDLGDFVQASGTMFRTRMGEVSLRVTAWRLLSKALSPLPLVKEQEVDGETVRYSAFADVEERYRQR